MKNKKLVLGIIIGVLVGGVIGIKASELISSSQVIYKDNKTVDVVLDSLFEELSLGKDKIAEAITNKGIETTSDSTLEEMASNIDLLASLLEEFEFVSYSAAQSAGVSHTFTLPSDGTYLVLGTAYYDETQAYTYYNHSITSSDAEYEILVDENSWNNTDGNYSYPKGVFIFKVVGKANDVVVYGHGINGSTSNRVNGQIILKIK